MKQYRFYNYKTYQAFQRDLKDIPNDAIVFIQDKLRIWTHNKEYVCDGPYTTDVDDNTLTFKNSLDDEVFKISYKNGLLKFENSKGEIDVQYASTRQLEEMQSDIEQLKATIASIGNITIPSEPVNITVDNRLNPTSTNPVQNKVIAEALSNKVDASTLEEYAKLTDVPENCVTKQELSAGLAGKQNTLTAGNGISIQGSEISVTLDVDPIVIVQELPSNPNPNKLYWLEVNDGEETQYIEYKWDANTQTWREEGEKAPEINLEPYMTKVQAQEDHDSIMQNVSDNYITKEDAHDTYQPVGDYATRQELRDESDVILDYADITYQKRGNYALAADMSRALSVVQQIIDDKYVLKRDVYLPGNAEWSKSDPTAISISGYDGQTVDDGSGNAGVANKMVTLTEQQYQNLVNRGLVDELTYYFTYEGEEETTNWTFGGTFPVILGGDSAIGEFPITLS